MAVLGVALTQRLAGQQQVSERDQSVPGSLCVPAVSEADFKSRFEEATRRRWDDSFAVYRNWLKHVEIIEFIANSDENQTFLSTARNVTPDDEVFLRVRRTNPLLYTYTFKLDRTDTAAEDLLTVIGSPVAAINPFAARAEESATDTESAANTAAEVAPAADAKQPAADFAKGTTDRVVQMMGGRSGRIGDPDASANASAEANRHFTAAEGHLLVARDALAAHLNRVKGVQPDVASLNAAVQAVADRSNALQHTDCTGQGEACLAQRVRGVIGDADEPSTLTGVIAIYDGLARRIANLSVPPAIIEAALAKAEAAVKDGVSSLRRAGLTEAQVSALPWPMALTKQVSDVREQAQEVTTRIIELRTSMSTLRTDLKGLQEALGTALARVQDADVCLALGRFPAQTTVTLTVELTKRATPEPPQAPRLEKLIELARSLLAEVERAGGGREPASDSTRATSTEKPEAEKPKPETEKPTPPIAHPTNTTFQVLRPVHVQTTLGYGTSFLAAPEFDFRSRTLEEVTDASGTVVTPAMKEITPFALDQNARQLLPMVQFGLHVKSRYPFAGADASSNESIRPWHRWIPFPTVGFALSAPIENYFLGGGLNVSRGVLAIAGVHFGKVKRLIAGRAQDIPFTILATDDFDIDDIVDEGIRTRFFFAVTVDSATIGKLFGPGGGDEGEQGGSKKNN